MTSPASRARRLFERSAPRESRVIGDILRAETTGGLLLIAAAVAALVWSNSPWSGSYADLRDLSLGPAALHLDLSVGAWAADGLLAIFFFVAGLELKRELVEGDLREPSHAALPVAAAVGGMIVPAAVFLAWTHATGGDGAGWAVPTATDIAFAVAVLAVISTHLPSGLRTFLLALAVVDDLLAITVIAVFYTHELHALPLLAALLPVAAFGFLAQRRVLSPVLLVPLAVVAWALVHDSGVHATVAGVLLAFTVPVRDPARPDSPGPAERMEHRVRPLSSGFAVPVFALFAAGVSVDGTSGLVDALTSPVGAAVIAGLVLGKPVGILASTWLLSSLTRAELDEDLAWVDVAGMALLAGIGFTVSLLIGELAYGPGTPDDDNVKAAVLVGSVAAGLLATVVLRARNRVYRRVCAAEEVG